MSKKTTWADVKKGSIVELSGREYRVVKIKPKGKKAAVMVETKGRYAESKVKLSDRVVIVKKGDGTKRGPLYDESGTARRWATKKEAAEVGVTGLPAGDSTMTKPPEKGKHGDPWERPADRIERKLDELLQARLVGVSTDEDAGYYVPPVNVTTVAAHLALFHGGIPEAVSDDEGKMLAVHEAQHAEALKLGAGLAVNHWHTKTRPESA